MSYDVFNFEEGFALLPQDAQRKDWCTFSLDRVRFVFVVQPNGQVIRRAEGLGGRDPAYAVCTQWTQRLSLFVKGDELEISIRNGVVVRVERPEDKTVWASDDQWHPYEGNIKGDRNEYSRWKKCR